MHRIFLLSPAKSSGKRAELIFNPRAGFDLAKQLQRGEARPIGEIFAFLSGLYFRGKLAYARRFARPPSRIAGGWVITPDRGLVPIDHPITQHDLRAFGEVPIEADEPRYRVPLEQSLAILRDLDDCEFVLLGSISTDKYVAALSAQLGARLLFPKDFVGRGDMSRGGLLLRHVRAGEELPYIPVLGALRRGVRPAKLAPLKRDARAKTPSRKS